MTDFNNFNDNITKYQFEPITLVDEVSTDLIYIGNSLGGKNTSAATWKIKKIWKDGTVWKTEFPNGDQNNIFVWNNRKNGTYSYA